LVIPIHLALGSPLGIAFYLPIAPPPESTS
jgi:hypothetical protein